LELRDFAPFCAVFSGNLVTAEEFWIVGKFECNKLKLQITARLKMQNLEEKHSEIRATKAQKEPILRNNRSV
jgi:hypothetical protein